MNLPYFSGVKSAWQNRRQPEDLKLLAGHYWHALLLITTLVFLGSFGLGFWEFSVLEGSSMQGTGPTVQAPPPTLDKTMFQNVLGAYGGRQSAYQTQLTAASTTVPDPSQ